MRNPLRLALLLCGAAASVQPAAAQTGAQAGAQLDSITWLSGEAVEPGVKSFAQTLVDFLQARWPELKQTIVHANARRAWQMVGNGEHACQISSLHTPEREKQAFFTDTLIGPPQQLIVRRDKAALLPRNAAGEVELARLVADDRLRGALVDGRSYGDLIDVQLGKLPRSANLIRYTASDFGSRMLPMLDKDRADYTFGYDVSLTHAPSGGGPLPSTTLLSVPIAGASAPLRAGVVCPRNAWGLAAIQHIDKLLGTPAGAAMLREEAERWLTPETRQRYAPRLDEFYRERAKPSLIR